MPQFLIPRLRLARPTLREFAEVFNKSGLIRNSIDALIEKFEGEDFSVALSSAYELIYTTVRALRLNAGQLAIVISELTSVSVVRDVFPSALRDLFEPGVYAFYPLYDLVFYPP
jgi:hypothetical protein